MGFFSWMTADANESISNVHSAYGARPVYLLQPQSAGGTAILEKEYDGYGVFGDTDAYVWLARNNLPSESLIGLTDDELRDIGITLGEGNYFVDKATGRKLSIFFKVPPAIAALATDIEFVPGRFDELIEAYGKSANELIAEGVLERKRFDHLVTKPLKFSFSGDANYETLAASENCPDQGFFYVTEDDEEDYDNDADEE